MSTVIRPEIKEKNKYHIGKHRYYELKHFCLQYWDWKKKLVELEEMDAVKSSTLSAAKPANMSLHDDISELAIKRRALKAKMELVETMAKSADRELYWYLMKTVTEGASYVNLRTKYDIPCGKNMFYDRYRKFFWLLDKER